MSQAFDAIVIGAGQAGPALAGRLTAAGMKVAIVERKLFGGTCVNTGCTPTKAMVASAYAAHLARHADAYGVRVGGKVEVDMRAVKARKDAIVAKSRDGLETWLDGMQGCTVFRGHARFVSAHEIKVGEELLRAPRIFINVGGRALVPDLPGVGDIPFLTNTSILELDTLPRHLVVVGGSYVGLEFAQIFRRLGSTVTVVERGAQLVGHEDDDVAAAIKTILEDEGIDIRLNSECIRFEPQPDDIKVGLKSDGEAVSGSHVLLAVGRRPNTDALDLDRAGIAMDARGYITVDDQLRTNVEGIWALGDCNGRGAFTHTAYNDFEIVADNLLLGAQRKISDRIGAYALYTDPPLGRVGMSEAEARGAGHRIRVGMRPMTRVARAVEKGESKGFMKIVIDDDSKQVLGGTILGVGGDEAIHGILDIMYAKAAYSVLKEAMHIHPTVSELIPTLLSELGPTET